MPLTALEPIGETLWVLGSIVVLTVFALILAASYRPRTRPGSGGHREAEEVSERVRPDGLIDSFAGLTEEAGGSIPWPIYVAFVAIPIAWVIYLVIFWAPKG